MAVDGWLWAAADEGGYPKTALGALIATLFAVVGGGAWLLRHVFTVTIPAQQSAHEKAMQALGEAHARAITGVGAQYEKSIALILEHHEKQCQRRQQIEEAESRAILAALQDQGEVLERLAARMDELRPRRQSPPRQT